MLTFIVFVLVVLAGHYWSEAGQRSLSRTGMERTFLRVVGFYLLGPLALIPGVTRQLGRLP